MFSGKNPQSLRFHPFTRAPRDCFGKNFAQAELRVRACLYVVAEGACVSVCC